MGRFLLPFLIIALPNIVFSNFIEYKIRLPKGEIPWDFALEKNHYQSPVDLSLDNVQQISIGYNNPLKLKAVHDNHIKYIIRNSGHGVEVVVDENEKAKKGAIVEPVLFGGILPDEYIFKNVHYHWGNQDDMGSEHLINGKSYSLEAHIVTYKESYGSFNEALNHKDGIVVLTFFAEVGKNNDDLDRLMKYLPKIREYGSGDTSIVGTDTAFWFLPEIGNVNTDYFAYPGSLTTPNYGECVTFIILPNPIPVSHKQLENFRHLSSNHHRPVTSNRRDLQYFGKRPIAYVKNNFVCDYLQPNNWYRHFNIEGDDSETSDYSD